MEYVYIIGFLVIAIIVCAIAIYINKKNTK